MSKKSQRFYEFGPFRLDTAERLLTRAGEVVALTPKAFETLVVLVERRGRLIGKDELMEALWPESAVEEANLTNNVYALRKAMGEGRDGQRYIETVPKHGYRFVADVRELPETDDALVVEKHSFTRIVTEEVEGREPPAPGDAEVHRIGATVPAPAAPRRPGAPALWNVAVACLLLLGAAAVLYRPWSSGGGRAAEAGAGSPRTIAVLPLFYEGGDADGEYLSDGLSESLINSLSRLPQLKVIARNSAFRYKGRDVRPQDAARELGVEAVLTGRVTQRGDRLIVSAELVDARDGTQVWGERYDRRLSDLPAVQAELARDISQQLRLKLSDEVQQRLATRDTENPEAYELYLKGRYALNSLTRQQESGLAYFRQAAEKDPRYAPAYAGMAEAYVEMADIGATFSLPPKEAYTLAKAAALRAVELDDTLAEAHVSLGRIAFHYEWDWPGAEREFKRAIALRPDFVPAHHWYSHYLISQGRFDESLAESLRGLALDPLDVAMNFHLGFHYWNARQYDQASAQLQKALAMNPNHPDTNGILGLVYAQQGRQRDAIEKLQKSMDLRGFDYRGLLGYVYATSGRRDEARRLLGQLQEEARSKVVSPYNIARIYAGLGEKEQALAWSERAIAERDSNLTMPGLKVDLTLVSLHSDPRFEDLLRRMGLPQ